jgi:hypothetical protein
VNSFVSEVYSESVHSLAVGFEPLDPLRGGRLVHPVRIDLDGVEPWSPRDPSEPYGPGPARRRWRRAAAERDRINPRDPLSRVDRHDSGLQVLLVQPGLGEELELRLYEYDRRYVPRRFHLDLDPLPQVRRPALFPGAAYDVSPCTTGLRGRVTRAGEPMRWVRVEARLPGPDVLVGRAHGDDRGEFLLLLAPEAAPFGDLSDPLEIQVTVFGPGVPPVPSPPSLAEQDAYWDLPLEMLGAPAQLEPVAAGETLPAGYVSTPPSTRLVPFRLGRIISSADGVLDFEF